MFQHREIDGTSGLAIILIKFKFSQVNLSKFIANIVRDELNYLPICCDLLHYYYYVYPTQYSELYQFQLRLRTISAWFQVGIYLSLAV